MYYLWFFASFVLIDNICTVDYEINPIATDKRTNKDVSENLGDQRCYSHVKIFLNFVTLLKVKLFLFVNTLILCYIVVLNHETDIEGNQNVLILILIDIEYMNQPLQTG